VPSSYLQPCCRYLKQQITRDLNSDNDVVARMMMMMMMAVVVVVVVAVDHRLLHSRISSQFCVVRLLIIIPRHTGGSVLQIEQTAYLSEWLAN